MTDHDDFLDDWSREDDDLIRGALDSLRHDVNDLPLPPLSQVKSRGTRRKQTIWRSAGAAVAAAAVVVAAVGLSGLGRPNGDNIDPATQSTSSITRSMTSSISSTPTSSATESTAPQLDWEQLLAAKPLIQPSAAEWQAAFGLAEEPTVAEPTALDTTPVCDLPVGDGIALDRQEVTAADAPSAFAHEWTWSYGSDQGAQDAAAAMGAAFDNCSRPSDMTQDFSDEFEEFGKLWRFTGDNGTAWVALANAGRDVTYLEVWDSPDGSPVTKSEMARIAWVAGQRLQRYAASDAGGAGSGSSGGDLPIAGPPARLPTGTLFVDPAAYSSALLTDGAETEAGPGDFEGSAQVLTACDADTAAEGEFGIVKIKESGADGSYFATQRIRKVESAQTEIDRLTTGFTDCTSRVGQTTTTAYPGPDAGMVKLATVFDDGSTPLVEYAIVTATKTPGYVSTIVVTVSAKELSDEPYYAELRRLGTLAAAR